MFLTRRRLKSIFNGQCTKWLLARLLSDGRPTTINEGVGSRPKTLVWLLIVAQTVTWQCHRLCWQTQGGGVVKKAHTSNTQMCGIRTVEDGAWWLTLVQRHSLNWSEDHHNVRFWFFFNRRFLDSLERDVACALEDWNALLFICFPATNFITFKTFHCQFPLFFKWSWFCWHRNFFGRGLEFELVFCWYEQIPK